MEVGAFYFKLSSILIQVTHVFVSHSPILLSFAMQNFLRSEFTGRIIQARMMHAPADSVQHVMSSKRHQMESYFGQLNLPNIIHHHSKAFRFNPITLILNFLLMD